MPVPNLLLGTRRLRREIDEQSQQLEHDIERVKSSGVQLRRTALARMTSPLGLLSATVAGFIAGKVAAHPSHPQQLSSRAFGSIVALALNTARAIGLQVLMPMAVEWVQSKFAHGKADEPSATDTNAESAVKAERDKTSQHP